MLSPIILALLLSPSRAFKPMRELPLEQIPIQQVQINDSFWSPKLRVWRDVTIEDCFAKFEKDGAISNFDRVASGRGGDHGGPPWYDGLIYEMITGVADFLASQPDTKLEARLDGYIERIAAAASNDRDGYLNTYTTLKEPDHRWGLNGGNDRWQHDLYNAGALVEAGVHYYRATGKTKLLGVAARMANLMSATMGPAPKKNVVPGHALAEKSFVDMYELFREKPQLKAQISIPIDEENYLRLAEFWIDGRGNHEGRTSFGAYDQDEIPVLQQETIEGHAVRAVLLCCGLIAAGRAGDKPEYLDVARRLWENMVSRRMYLTGGVGAMPDDEKFGPDYFLPNDGYAETCASVGAAFFHEQMNLQYADAKYADEMERALYNGVLSGVSYEGNRYFYENPLASGKNRARWEWHGCPCCPPMFLKAMGALPGLIYAQGKDSLYANLYIGSKANLSFEGTQVSVKQITNYPWDGRVRITADPQRPTKFSLKMRIPGWCLNPSIRVNGRLLSGWTKDRGYAVVSRLWDKGDDVDLSFPMPIERVHADPRVEADKGRVALRRGPLVYCLEGIDNHDSLGSLVIAAGGSYTLQFEKRLFGGVTVIRGRAARIEQVSGTSEKKVSQEPFTAIPYYLNANRAHSEMAVWMAETPVVAKASLPLSLASAAHASASHCNPSDTLETLNDRVVPSASDDQAIPRFTWWDHRGTSEWVQYDFDRPTKVSSVGAYWWDERRIHANCRVPQSWRVLYKDGNDWKPVEVSSPFGTDMDRFNFVNFNPVATRSIRLEVQLQPGWSGGLLKLSVN
jgi:DUF1680 family protein